MKKFLYDEIAKRWLANRGSVWIISDPHFNDPEMAHIRKDYVGDDEMVRRINSKVGKNDTIVFLGDIGDVSFVKRIKGYKVLIMGNHDKGASNYLKVLEKTTYCNEDVPEKHREYVRKMGLAAIPYPDLMAMYGNWLQETFDKKVYKNEGLFDEVYEGPLMINDKVILSHEPIENLPEYMFNIHGHDHSNWFTGVRHLNVCAEHIGYFPIHFASLYKDGKMSDVESIHRITIDEAVVRKSKKGK